MTHALKISGLHKSFGGLKAIDNFCLELEPHAIQGIIGPNGAGKTTIFNLVTGMYRPDSGGIWLKGKEITRLPVHEIARLGIARTFQNIRLFRQMTVLDHIRISFHARAGYGFWQTLVRAPRFLQNETRIRDESLSFLERFGLAGRSDDLAQNLSYGEQRRLEMARALATGAEILLLDEPAAGLNPREVKDLIDLIRKVHEDFSVSILLIEHQLPVVMALCRHVQVLNFGRLIAEGSPEDVVRHPEVIAAYLGEKEVA